MCRFQMFHLQCVNLIRNIQTSNKMNFNIFDVFYSQYSHQEVSVGVSAIFRVMLLLPQYKSRDVVSCVVYRFELVVGDVWSVWYTGWNWL